MSGGRSGVIEKNEKDQSTLFVPEQFGQDGRTKDTTDPSSTVYLIGLLGEDLKEFPRDFCSNLVDNCKCVVLPDDPLHVEQDSHGDLVLKNADGIFAKVHNPAEAKFLLYSQLRGHTEVMLPEKMIDIFKTVKAYENYLRNLRLKLFAKFFKKAGLESVANYEIGKLFRLLGLPKLDM